MCVFLWGELTHNRQAVIPLSSLLLHLGCRTSTLGYVLLQLFWLFAPSALLIKAALQVPFLLILWNLQVERGNSYHSSPTHTLTLPPSHLIGNELAQDHTINE